MKNQTAAELDALQAEVDAVKRLQAETPANKNTGQAAADPPSSDFGATGLDALLPAILPSSHCFDETGDRAFTRLHVISP